VQRPASQAHLPSRLNWSSCGCCHIAWSILLAPAPLLLQLGSGLMELRSDAGEGGGLGLL
jgi:hypothetical protein